MEIKAVNIPLTPLYGTLNKVLLLSTKVIGVLLPQAVPIRAEDKEFLIWVDPRLTILSGLRGDSQTRTIYEQGVCAEATLTLNKWDRQISHGKQVNEEINCKEIY